MLLAPALLTLVLGTWDLGTPSYWRDKAATLDAERTHLAVPVCARRRRRPTW